MSLECGDVFDDVFVQLHVQGSELGLSFGGDIELAEVALKFRSEFRPIVEPVGFVLVFEMVFEPSEGEVVEIRSGVGDLLGVGVEPLRVGTED